MCIASCKARMKENELMIGISNAVNTTYPDRFDFLSGNMSAFVLFWTRLVSKNKALTFLRGNSLVIMVCIKASW